MHCVLALVTMYAGLVHSFSWEIVTTVSHSNRLDFYDVNGTLTHKENITSPWGTINNIIYDPVHDRVLYADLQNIYSFEITTRKKECLIRDTNKNVNSLGYDPATELLFWIEHHTYLYSISLKLGSNNNKVNEKQLISLGKVWLYTITVDSCGGFIYYLYVSEFNENGFGRARFDGSEREILIVFHNNVSIFLDTDQQSHKSFWSDDFNSKYDETTGAYNFTLKYADLNGQNIRTINQLAPSMFSYGLTASKGFIYWRINDILHGNGTIWKIPKNPPSDTDMESKPFVHYDKLISGVAHKYNIEDIIRVNKNCDTLKSLLPNNSTDVNPLCVHGTKVCGESGCECTQGNSGERCEISVCYNYCLHGNCNASAEGPPKCRCNAGYSGTRCEVNACQAYCLNEGICSLSEESVPVCQCTGGHQGDRCEVPVFLTKCIQTVSMLRDLLNTDVTSVKGAKSTGASTPSTVV